MTLPGSIRERIEKCSSLPTLPSVALRVLELCQREQLDLNQIAEVISKDPALSAKLLRTANSPIFALRREVTTISNAVGLLGLNAIRTLVLSFSLTGSCQAGSRPSMSDYWRRSVLSALAAREMCQGSFTEIREEAFLCALLQDIGMLALAQVLGKQYTDIMTKAKRDHDKLIELEHAGFGADHAQVGAWLLERWRVPPILAQVVAGSHTPAFQRDSAQSEHGSVLARAVALSGRFADQWAGDPKLAPVRLLEEVAIAQANGVPISVEAVNARLIAQAPNLAPLFNVKLDAAEMASALEQAQEVLLALSVRTSQELTGIHEALARLESRTATLLAEAQKDPLTGVANRAFTSSYLDEVFGAAISSQRLLGVIFADVDHFKNVNDTYGHSAGDAVLRSVAQNIAASVRGGDFVGRWGGEEFIIVLRADNISDVSIVAERVRSHIAEARHQTGAGRSLSVTISLGCALLDTSRHQKAADMVEEADRALYDAKRGGRNQFRMVKAA
jgi:diguanylate cyclase (GGDEF)-like protein